MEGMVMKLFYDRKSKDPIYYIQQGIRNGKKTTTKNVKRIGKHSELLAITSDPLAYAHEQVAAFNKEFKEGKVDMTLKIDFSEKLSPTSDTASRSSLLNVGYLILQKVYHDLGIADFFAPVQSASRITFSCNEINRFLTFGRILDPRSKLGIYDRLDTYFEQPGFDYQHILRFMDILEGHYSDYISYLFEHSGKVISRDTSVCYFDCTNFYFETETEDPEYVDEVTGEILKGLRRYGPSKEHRPNPIVQMGLFMDGKGIPISMCINPGSDNEQACAVPMAEEITRMFGGKKFIYCADAGLGSVNIRRYQSMGGRAFVVTQSVKKLSDVLQQAIFDDSDYRLLSDNSPVTLERMKGFERMKEENRGLYNDVAYKVLTADRAIDVGFSEDKLLKNGKAVKANSKACLKQKIIVTFSRKELEYQRFIRNSQIERARSILKDQRVEDVKKGPNDVTRFIKRISTGKDGAKAADYYTIDEARIREEEKYDGFYAVATNLDDKPKDILKINESRYKIEDCFRIMKTNFRSRPIYHHKRPRIIAHFMVCYTALLISQLLQNKLDDYGTHFTTEDILETLKNMNVSNNQDLYYAAQYRGSKVCTALNGLYGLGLDKKYYLPKDLHKMIKKIAD
jgi:transposase